MTAWLGVATCLCLRVNKRHPNCPLHGIRIPVRIGQYVFDIPLNEDGTITVGEGPDLPTGLDLDDTLKLYGIDADRRRYYAELLWDWG